MQSLLAHLRLLKGFRLVCIIEAAGIESNKVRVDVQDGKLVISRI